MVFSGTETTLEERDWTEHATVLSGDGWMHTVVYCSQETNATVDAFSITQGFAVGSTYYANSAHRLGGGLYNAGTMTLVNSTVSENSADGAAGIYNSGTLAIANSTIAQNTVLKTIGGGGGVLSIGTMVISESTISDNSAAGGGGILSSGSLWIENSTVAHNTATGPDTGNIYGGSSGGGGIYNNGGDLTIVDCSISDNTAVGSGGAIYGSYGTFAIASSTLSGNTAVTGGGIGAIMATLTVHDSSFLGNSATGTYGSGIGGESTPTVVRY